MHEIVFQVKTYTEWKNLVTGVGNENCPANDLGIYKTLEAAVKAIEEEANGILVAALDLGNWAWIDARPAETVEIDYLDDDEYFAKGIMIFDRTSGDVDRIDYYVATRTVKESA